LNQRNWTGWSLKSGKKFWRAWFPETALLRSRLRQARRGKARREGRGSQPAGPGVPRVRPSAALRPARATPGDHRRRRGPCLRQRAAHQDRPVHRFPHRPHHPQARSHPRRSRQGLPRGAPVPFRQRVREPLLGAPGAPPNWPVGRQDLHRGGFPRWALPPPKPRWRKPASPCAMARRKSTW